MKNIGTYKNDLSIPRKKDIDAKQDKITASGFLVGDGAGGISAQESIEASAVEVPNGLLKGVDGSITTAVAGTDYVAPDDIPSEVFVAKYNSTPYAEIKAAYDAGALCVCRRGSTWWATLNMISDLAAYFSYSSITGYGVKITTISVSKSSNTWVETTEYAVPTTRTINGKALSSNITLGATYTATLTASGWTTSGDWKTQTVTVSGLKASYNAAPFVDVALTGTDAAGDADLSAAWMAISATAIADTGANSITVKFPATVDTPTANIPIRITVYD